MVSRPASICGYGTFKTQFDQVEFVDEDIDYTHRVGIGHVIVEAFGEQCTLAPMFTLDEALHGRSLR